MNAPKQRFARRRRRILYAVCAVALLAACSTSPAGSGDSSGGCAGNSVDANGAPLTYPDPPFLGGAVYPSVVRARITQGLLTFLGDNLGALLTGAGITTAESGRAVFYFDETLLGSDGAFTLRDGCLGEPTASGHCAQPTGTSSIAFDQAQLADSLELAWLNPDPSGRPAVQITLRDLDVFVDMVAVIQQSGDLPIALPPAACHIRDGADGAALHLKYISFDLRLAVARDDADDDLPRFAGSLENIAFDLGGSTENPLEHMAINACAGTDSSPSVTAAASCVDPACDRRASATGSACSLCDVGAAAQPLGGFFAEVFEPMLQQLAPTLAEAISEPLLAALANAPLGTTTALDLGAMAGPAFARTKPLTMLLGASDDLDTRGQGLGFGLDAGVDMGITAPPAPCARWADPPDDWTQLLGPAPDFSGFLEVPDPVEGSRMERYHAAFAISQALLNQLSWNAFQSGLLCFSMDGYDIADLTGDAFVLSAGLLMDLESSLRGLTTPTTPMLLSVRASEAPRLRLGAGRTIAPGVIEPTIAVTLDDLATGFYMLIDGAQLQISEMLLDARVELAFERNANGQVDIVVKDLAVEDVRQVYNEIAPAADVSPVISTVVDLAVGAVLGDSLRFPLDLGTLLRDATGIPIDMRINAIRRDLGPTDVPHLTAYLTLCDDGDVSNPDNPLCFRPGATGTATASLERRERAARSGSGGENNPFFAPAAQVAVRTQSLQAAMASSAWAQHPLSSYFETAPSGRVQLQIDTDNVPSAETRPPSARGALMVQARVDNSPWRPYQQVPASGILELQHPRLLLKGEHSIQLRQRYQHNPLTTGPIQTVHVTVAGAQRNDVPAPESAHTLTQPGAETAPAAKDSANGAAAATAAPSSANASGASGGCTQLPASAAQLWALVGLVGWLARRRRPQPPARS